MYLYFNENGVLKEIINDEALRQGNYNINKMYIYIENRTANSVNVQYLLSDGTQTTTEQFSTVVTNVEIPFDRKRDLYYFKYYTPYRFIVVNLEADINGISPLDVAGWVHCSLSANLVTSNILQLGEVTFNVEADGLKHNTIPTEYLTLSDYLYFRSLLNGKQNIINSDNKLPAEYIEEDNTHKFVTNTELERLNSVGLVELSGSSGILTEQQLADLEKPFCFINHDDLVYSLYSIDGSILTFIYEHATKGGVTISRIAVVTTTHAWSKLSDVTYTYNPLTTTGDIIYAEDTGVMTRLGIGNTSQILAVVDGRPAWVNATPIQAEGDLIVGDSEGKPKRLPKGNNGQVLKMVSGEPAWADDESGMANPMTTFGDMIVADDGGSPVRLPKGSNGQVLTIDNSFPKWKDLPPVDQNYSSTSDNAQSGKAVKQAIDSAISTVYRPQGSSSVSALNSAPHLESMNGWVFNLTDGGTLTNYDNSTISVVAGDNVVFLWNGGNWKWDSLSGFVDLSGKQDTLVSGTNIKTINGQSVLGSGDIDTEQIGTITLDGTVTSGTLTEAQIEIISYGYTDMIVYYNNVAYRPVNDNFFTFKPIDDITGTVKNNSQINFIFPDGLWTYTTSPIDLQNVGVITLTGDSGTLTSGQKAILQNKPVTFIVHSNNVYSLSSIGGYSYYFHYLQQTATTDTRKVITINASSSTYSWVQNTYTYTRNPMTTTGDMIKGSADGTMTRLPKGTTGQFLKSGASDVEWGDVIPTVTIDISQVVSADPLKVQLTNDQYNVFANNKQVLIDLSALGQTTVIWQYVYDDSGILKFMFIGDISAEEGIDNYILEIDKSTKEVLYINYNINKVYADNITLHGDTGNGYGELALTGNLPYLTTAPTENNTSGYLKIVVLSSEPSTKYDGYLYLVLGGN